MKFPVLIFVLLISGATYGQIKVSDNQRFLIDKDGKTDAKKEKGCGCGAGGGASPLLTLAALGLIIGLVRRRRS